MNPNKHHIKKWASERKVAGEPKTTVYCFGCGPCGIYSRSFKTRHGRDHAAEEHEAERDPS